MPLLANFHTHTDFCDGKNTAREMIEAALSLGFLHLGLSSHGYTWFDREFLLDTEAYFKECRALQQEYADRINLLVGIEQDCLADPEPNREADFLIGSTHYLKIGDQYPAVDDTFEMAECTVREYFGGDWYRYCRAYYEQEAEVFERTGCTFIGHFDLVTRFNDEHPRFDEQDPRYLRPALEVMEYLAGKGIPFEINTGALNRGRKKAPYPAPPLLKALRSFGGEILISSDAHSVDKLDGCFDEAVREAVAAGFTHTNILTKNGWKQLALDRVI
ncbi:MAG: histidinol-phosphatase [Eubacteriales bacterium]|nr:histidinol-phosphatase [Eubacteriales bacterium]